MSATCCRAPPVSGANAQALARYAALCQEQNLVPIVEPEVLMDGSHSLEYCEAITGTVLHNVFAALDEQRVRLEGMLLKPASMVIAGKDCPHQASVQEVAAVTLRVLRRHVPAAVPGIAFPSGGQDERAATVHLDAINRLPGPKPWKISFSMAAHCRITPWRHGTARTRSWRRAGAPYTSAPAVTTRPVSAGTQTTWSIFLSVLSPRTIAKNGTTTDPKNRVRCHDGYLSMTISPLAGKPAPKGMLIDPAPLETAYYEPRLKLDDPQQRVSFGTSGHRGRRSTARSPRPTSSRSPRPSANTGAGSIEVRSTWARTHTPSPPGQRTALEVLAGNGVKAVIQRERRCHADAGDLARDPDHNRGRRSRTAS